MPDERLFNELVALANGDVDMSVYTNDIFNVLKQSIKRSYVDKLYALLDEYKQKSKNDFHNEIQLFEAIKPFVSDDNTGKFDQLEDMFCSVNAMRHLVSDVTSMRNNVPNNNNQNSTKDNIVNNDGVYEVDDNYPISSNSLANFGNMNPAMLLMLMLFMK